MTNISAITDAFSVAPQLQARDFVKAAALGFKSIVNMRPDGEVEGCLSDAQASSLAVENDLAYAHVPVALSGAMPEQVATFEKLLSSLPAPILAYCGSGRRAAILWALVSAKTVGVDDILNCCGRGGHDLGALRPDLKALVAEAGAR